MKNIKTSVMDYQQKYNKLQKLLEQLYIIEPEKKAKLLANFENLSQKDQKYLLVVIEKSVQKQDKFLEIALKNKPELITEIKGEVHKAQKEENDKKEEISHQEEIKVLQDLEAELLRI
jgi:Fe2+ transport system protein B